MTSPHCVSRLLLVFGASAFAASLSAQPTEAASRNDETILLSKFEVTAEQDRGYTSTNAVGGTRFNTAIVDVPQSVVVLNQDFMRDVGALSVIEAAQYVSGVSTTAGPEREVFNVRGYQVGVTTDGLPDGSPTAQGRSTPFELLDRVEILKGPSAVLYGSTSPGGNVNRITKKPQFKDHSEVKGTAGNLGFYHGVFDVNKLVSDNVAVRVIGSHEHADYSGNFEDANSWFLAPMVGVKFGERTNLVIMPYWLERDYHKKFATLFQFRPYDQTGEISFELPRRADWGGKHAREDISIARIYAQLDHQVNDRLSMRFSAITKDHEESNNDIIPRDLLPDNRTMQRTWRVIRTQGDDKVLAFDSLLDSQIGNTANKTLFLVQYTKSETAANIETGRKLTGQNTAAGENSNATFSNLPLIDVFNPDPIALDARPDTTFISSSTYTEGEVLAASLQHQITMFDNRLVASGGVRYDHTDALGRNELTNTVTSSGSNSHYTMRGGVVYKALPGLALFYNYSETFAPIFSVNPDGTGFDPTNGFTHEVGVKTDLMSGRISGTLSAFTIENRNLLVVDPDPERASAGYRSQSAKDTLEGLELDLHFNLVENLQLMASFSTIESQTNNGLRVRNVPDQTAALFASYKFGGGNLGWSIGAGARYKGEHPGDAANAFFLDSATVYDAFITYVHSDALRVQVNANNVTDEYYADSSISRNLIFAGPERRIRVTVGYQF
jgi:iron complex outermembrane receptor protein